MEKKLLDSVKMRLPINVLNVDKYQKKIRERVVNKIVNNFDPTAVGVIHVSQRKEGALWIFNGQHRVEAMKRLGYESVDCLVFTGMTYEQESRALVSHHDVSKPTKAEEHNAKLEAKNTESLAIETALNSIGLRISQGSGVGVIQAAGTVYSIYRKQGVGTLLGALKILQESFGNHRDVFLRQNMNGMATFINEYSDKFDRVRLVKKLKENDISEVVNKANIYKRVNGFSPDEATKLVITEHYNHNKKTNKLK